jgi:DNA polymerase-3 subunit epsilon
MNATRNKGKRLSVYVPDYIVFDLETTGVSLLWDTIIEISAVKVINGKMTGKYSTLVNPLRHIPAGATAINSITDTMVANAPKLTEAMEGFLDFIQDGILVGHNIHTFDMNFVYDAVWQLYGDKVRNEYIDTLYLARQCLPQLAHHTLGDVATHFKIATEGSHRALNDCIINHQCYENLGKLLAKASDSIKPDSIKEEGACPECGCILVRRKGRFGFFYGCSGYPHCRYTKNV